MSAAWQRHDAQIRREGGIIREGVESLPVEAQELRDGDDAPGDPEKVVKSRLRKRDSAIGLDSGLMTHSGLETTIIAETPEIVGGKPTGDILTQYVAWGQDDKPRTYEVRWHKVREGSHVADRPRRIFT
ncbi:MAG: hypothetical protein ACHQC8_02465 [Solirubrobacterales bacterium]